MDYKEQLEQLKTELANAETPEQLSEAEFKIKKLKMQKELTDMEESSEEKSEEVSTSNDTESESEPTTVSGLVEKYGLDNRTKILSVISARTGLSFVSADNVLNTYVDKGIDGELTITPVSDIYTDEDVENEKYSKKSDQKKNSLTRGKRRKGILVPGLILLAVLLVIMISVYSANGYINATPDYPDERSFESALEYGVNPVGKTVSITARTIVPNSAFGYNIQTGQHLNFCSTSHPNVQQGDTIIVEVTDVQSMLGSYIIAYKKTNKIKVVLNNLSNRLFSGY